MQLRNFMESAVSQALKTVLEQMPDICQCERCRLDIMALALNKLPPKYTLTHSGEVFTRLNMWDVGNQAAVLSEVTRAAMIVSGHPNHEVPLKKKEV
ncbi:MAG TPA: late competence development ComFB family protein [Bacillota bacterium]|nr:late competence development ComFB family protein [Bacillota bacterium]